MCSVTPRVRKKTGSLAPWDNLSINQIKEIVDEVFGDGVHQVAEDGVWVGEFSWLLIVAFRHEIGRCWCVGKGV